MYNISALHISLSLSTETRQEKPCCHKEAAGCSVFLPTPNDRMTLRLSDCYLLIYLHLLPKSRCDRMWNST